MSSSQVEGVVPRWYPIVARLAEGEDAKKDWIQKQDSQTKPETLSKSSGEFEDCEDCDDSVHNRNQQQKKIPSFAPGDLEVQIIIVKRNQRAPTRLEGFLEDRPAANQAIDCVHDKKIFYIVQSTKKHMP